jgi:TRAP-type C4-dicarboxylate transport system substrate-binding protein
MARTRHIAGVLGLFASSVGMARLPQGIRAALEQAATDASKEQRAMGPREDITATGELAAQGMIIRELDGQYFHPAAERLWNTEGGALGVGSWLEAIRA